MTQTRREFFDTLLAAAAAGATTFGAQPLLARNPRCSPNETIRVGVAGVRGRGRAHIGAFKNMDNVEVVALCDPDEAVVDLARKSVPDAKYHKDIRSMLDDDSLDVIAIATPNHWHSLASIWALQAGKHVYVEKPLSHDVYEGRALVEIAASSGLVVQHGTQARSAKATREAMQFLHDGGLGKVSVARALCYKRRGSIGKVDGPQQPPSSVDYKLWCGPAGDHPLTRRNLHYDWHWNFATGNGDLGNQGVHQMDIARWGLGVGTLPTHIQSVGGRVGYVDDGNTPNTQLALFDYGEQQLIFEVRGLKTPGYKGASIGVVFEGEKGYLVSASYNRVQAFDREGQAIATFEGGDNHFGQFMECVRANDPGAVNATPLEGHLSSALCHLGNISYKLGLPTPVGDLGNSFDKFPNGAGLEIGAEAIDRFGKHLADNNIDTKKEFGLVGPALTLDPKAERFHGERANEANQLLRKPPVDGFMVPDLAV